MDYTREPLAFKVRKALRYIRMYGPRRTLIKIEGQYHMQRRYDQLPNIVAGDDVRKHVAVMGCGNYAFSTVAYFLNRNYGPVISKTMDIVADHAASLCAKYGGQSYSTDPQSVFEDPKVDLVYICSNHASHADYAVGALMHGKAVHIEKPHVVSESQLRKLCSVMEATGGRVNLGFNRPKSSLGRRIVDELGKENGASMFNWFVAGHEIPPDHWYMQHGEGGRVLGNLCHWTDFILHLVAPPARYPIVINAIRSSYSESDLAITYLFGDGTIAAITFSAKGHTFEGVRERFAAHRGNLLLGMDDFQSLVIERMETKVVHRLLFRDHGHEENVRRSYRLVRPEGTSDAGCTVDYVWQTGLLFLKSREAIDSQLPVTITARESYRYADVQEASPVK